MEKAQYPLLAQKARDVLAQSETISERLAYVAEGGLLGKEIRAFLVSVAGRLKLDCMIQDWKQDFSPNDDEYIWFQLYPNAWKLPKVGPVALTFCWSNPFASEPEDPYVSLRIPWNWLRAQALKGVIAPNIPEGFTDVTDIEDPDQNEAYWRYLKFQEFTADFHFDVEAFYQAILSGFRSLLSLRPVMDEYISHCADGPELRRARRELGILAVVDTETAGTQQELIELAVVNAAYDRRSGEVSGILEQYEALREPKCPISPAEQRLNGLGIEQVRGQKLDENRVRSLLARADFVVAHNASFDQARLEEQFGWAADLLKGKWRDSLNDVDWKTEARDLQSLLADHKIDCEVAHRAGPDARALLELLSYGGNGTRGTYLKQLMPLAAAAEVN